MSLTVALAYPCIYMLRFHIHRKLHITTCKACLTAKLEPKGKGICWCKLEWSWSAFGLWTLGQVLRGETSVPSSEGMEKECLTWRVRRLDGQCSRSGDHMKRWSYGHRLQDFHCRLKDWRGWGSLNILGQGFNVI